MDVITKQSPILRSESIHDSIQGKMKNTTISDNCSGDFVAVYLFNLLSGTCSIRYKSYDFWDALGGSRCHDMIDIWIKSE